MSAASVEVAMSDGLGSSAVATASVENHGIPIKEMAVDMLVNPYCGAAISDALTNRLNKFSNSAKAMKEAAVLKKLGKDEKVTEDELANDLTIPSLKSVSPI